MAISLPFRYSKLAYAALNVIDLRKSVDFYRDIVGLNVVKENGKSAYLRCGQDHHSLLLVQATERGLKRVAFEMECEGDLQAAYYHFEALGMEPVWIPDDERKELRQGPGLRVRERNSGLLFELFVGNLHLSTPYIPTVAKIERIGHVVIGSVNSAKCCDSLVLDFGFRISDLIENWLVFLRCHPNPYHHTIAVAPASRSHLHHVNFMVADIDDIGRALYRMRKHDVKTVFGPGRHPPSNSVFFYFLDPDGMTVEYSFGMEEFPEQGARGPRYMEPVPQSLDTWGATPDAQFGQSGSIEGATSATIKVVA